MFVSLIKVAASDHFISNHPAGHHFFKTHLMAAILKLLHATECDLFL